MREQKQSIGSVSQIAVAELARNMRQTIENWRVGYNLRTALAGLLVCAGYYLGSRIGFALTLQPSPVSVLWPPNSILLAALLLSPTRVWWFLLLAAFPAHWFAQFQSQVPATMILSWFISNCSEALIGAGLMRCVTESPIRFDRLRSVGVFFLCGVFLGPFLSSFLDAALVRLNNWGQAGYWDIWRIRFSSNVLAAVTVTPVIVTWATVRTGSLRGTDRGHYFRTSLLFVGLLSVSFGVFYRLGPDADPALLLAPLPFLLWAAVRFGPRELSTALLAVAFVAIWGGANAHGPFSARSSEENALAIQTFVTVLSIPLMLLAAVLQERGKAEERFAKAFHSSPDATAITRLKDGQIVETNERWEALLGYTRDEAIGRTLFELNIWASAADRKKLLIGMSSGRILHDHELSLELELSLRTSSGELRQTLVSTDTADIGEELCLILVFRDVTERQRAAAALRESEERYRVVAETASDAIITIDEQSVIQFANRAAEKIFGYAVEEMRGRELTMLIPDYARMSHQASLEQSVRTGHLAWEMVEQSGLHKDGRVIPLEISFAEFMNGGRRCFTGIMRDITERKRAQEILEESEERYREVVESQTDLVCRYRADTTLTFVNEAYCRFFQKRREELIGSKFLELLPRTAWDTVLKDIASLNKEHRTQTHEHEVILPDGSIGWQQWINHPIVEPDGSVVEYQAVGRDIIDRKRAEEARRHLTHATRVSTLGALAGSLAHELNQPLTAILSNAQAGSRFLTEATPNVAEVREVLQDIAHETKRAGEVIRQMRKLVKKGELQFEAIDLNQVIHDVVRLLHSDMVIRKVQLVLDFQAELPPVHGDAIQLQQVLLNLLLNASDSMKDVRESERTVCVRTRHPDPSTVQIEVSDRGTGIHPKGLAGIFEPFQTTKPDGLGLGLSISRSIVDAHGGRLWVKNNADRGATFSFTIPINSVPAN
jgi:PAS domain S-box-containing protein